MTAHESARPDTDDAPIQLVLVSGFLGAGKTTALRTIGQRLSEQGYTVGMITNDQASGLVDTSILDTTDGTVVEIPGGCFCCNFNDLVRAAHSIKNEGVDIVLTEPVGSCTDLVATVVNPLRSLHAAAYDVAPLSVLLDPDRVRAYLDDDTGRLPEEVAYIFRLQIEEADLIVLNKTDTLTDAETARLVSELGERAGDRPVLPISALRGTGIDDWMTAIFNDDTAATAAESGYEATVAAKGRALTDVDYDTYADGEAQLGWVNTSGTVAGPVDSTQVRTTLMQRLQQALQATGIEVAHLKFSLAADGQLCHANLTSTHSQPRYSDSTIGTVSDLELVLNIRAVGNPTELQTIAETALQETATAVGSGVTVGETQAFRPDYPEPVHRMDGDAEAD